MERRDLIIAAVHGQRIAKGKLELFQLFQKIPPRIVIYLLSVHLSFQTARFLTVPRVFSNFIR